MTFLPQFPGQRLLTGRPPRSVYSHYDQSLSLQCLAKRVFAIATGVNLNMRLDTTVTRDRLEPPLVELFGDLGALKRQWVGYHRGSQEPDPPVQIVGQFSRCF